mmetsp:Transcript_104509/g.239486  ORF Transcript_104509/g.239486 Transcript_104509/m.239486 type:complete len:87 (+) Transcript_104509:103-363(+)
MRSPLVIAQRNFTVSRVTMGHNLEDHFDMAEYMTAMHNPMTVYSIYIMAIIAALLVVVPLLHSNYYFTGRFLPKDQGNTQLTDDSW